MRLTIPGGCLKDWGQEDSFECSMLDALMLVGLRPRWLHASIVGEFDHKLTFSCLDSGYFRKSLFSRYIAYELTKMSEICMLTFVVSFPYMPIFSCLSISPLSTTPSLFPMFFWPILSQDIVNIIVPRAECLRAGTLCRKNTCPEEASTSARLSSYSGTPIKIR